MNAPAGTLSIVVPAFNEEHRLPETLARLTEYLVSTPWQWEVRVVDDGSTDDTAAVVTACSSRMPGIVLQRAPHRGKGAAVKAGLLASRAQYRFMCDADLSMPVHELARFLPPHADADVVIGSREGATARRIGEPLRRHAAGRVFNAIVRTLLRLDIADTQCGFKLFTGRAAERILPHVRVEGWAFDLEALVVARAAGLRVVELPIEWHYRERSQVSLVRDSVAMLGEAVRIRAREARGVYGEA